MKTIFISINKLVLIISTLVTLSVLLSGCGNDDNKESDKLDIVTTIYAPYDFAKQIVGDKGDVKMLLKPGSETHSFEPTPQDIITIGKCDVFIYVGGENDEWVDGVLDSVENKNMKVIKLLDLVDTVEEELIEGMEEVEEEKGEHGSETEPEWDEHVWTSPKNAVTICNSFAKTFSEADADNADVYSKNCKQYIKKIEEVDKVIAEVVSKAKTKRVVFGDRFPLRYFVEEFGLKYYAAFPGCSNDSEASAATIAFLTDKIKEDKIPVVYKIELSNGNIAKTLAEQTGAKVLTFYSCHNITDEDFKAGTTYVDFMWKNVDSLKEALY